MKKILAGLFIIYGTVAFGQKSQVILSNITKNPIRKTNLTLPKSQADKATNRSMTARAVSPPKYLQDPAATVETTTIFINNPNKTAIKFAVGNNDVMSIHTIKPNSYWKGEVNENWQNFILRTNNKDVAYSIRAYNCFNIYWNAGKGSWDLQKTKCSRYINLE